MATFNDNEFVFEIEDQKFCPVCGSHEVQFKTTRNYKIASAGEAPIQYFECTACTHQFMSPRPTDKSLEVLYSTGAYRAMLSGSGNNNGGPTLGNFSEEAIRGKRVIWELVRMIKEGKIYANKICDVGGSTGTLIYMLVIDIRKETGGKPKFLNIEPDSVFAYEGRKVGIPDVRSIEQAKEDGPFDLITCVHVLEHMNNPLSFLREMKSLGTTGTTYAIEVPHTDDPSAAYSLFHPQAFSGKSLELLIERAGLKPMTYKEQKLPGGKILNQLIVAKEA
jgi:hypothetical protein